MIKETLIHLFSKDLERLKNEVSAYKNETNLWVLDGTILNTAGNLTLHLVGNLNHFVGHVLGKTDYIRNRPYEFTGKDVPKTELIQQIDETITVVKQSINTLTQKDLEKEYPIQILKDEAPMSTFQMLSHLTNHLNYHLGQINYHRRLLDK